VAGLHWIEIDTDLPEHKKSLALGLRLGDPRAWTYMAQLFLWCARNNPTGRFEGEDATAMICYASGWARDASQFVSAAESVGFLDRDEDGSLVVHDLAERLAAHIAARAKNARRQKEWRKRVAKKYKGVTRDVTVTQPQRDRDVEGNSNKNKNSNDQKQQPLAAAPQPTPPPAPKPTGTDPRFAPLKAVWMEEYQRRYGAPYDSWGAADALGLHKRLAVPLEVFRDKARRGLATTGYGHTATCAELCSPKLWARLAGSGPPANQPVVKRAVGSVGDFTKPESNEF
jgi:hypothetical protein